MRADEQDRLVKTRSQSHTLLMWSFWIGMMSVLVLVLVLVLGYLKIDSKFIEPIEYGRSPDLSSAAQSLQQDRSVQHELIKANPHTTESPSPKQTVFNDQNYQPKGLVNSIAPPPSRYYASRSAGSNAQVRQVPQPVNEPTTIRTIPWAWESVKTQRSGTFTYKQTSSGIDTMSVCRNYKSGSFIYRDCRKAAKKYFQEVCSNDFRAACGAADMIP